MAGLKLGKEMRDGRVWMKTEAIFGWTDKKQSPSLGFRQAEYASGVQGHMAASPGEQTVTICFWEHTHRLCSKKCRKHQFGGRG